MTTFSEKQAVAIKNLAKLLGTGEAPFYSFEPGVPLMGFKGGILGVLGEIDREHILNGCFQVAIPEAFFRHAKRDSAISYLCEIFQGSPYRTHHEDGHHYIQVALNGWDGPDKPERVDFARAVYERLEAEIKAIKATSAAKGGGRQEGRNR